MPSKFKLQHLEYSTFVGLVRCGEEMVSLSTRILQFIFYVNTDIYMVCITYDYLFLK